MAKIDYSALKKGGFMRQKQKGYFSLRIQVVGGNLTSENIRAVADVADKYGKGYVHMTSRQGYFSSKDGYAYQKEGRKTLKTCRKMSQFL